MRSAGIIDAHTHIIPETIVKKIKHNDVPGYNLSPDGTTITCSDGSRHPMKSSFYNFDERKIYMDQVGVSGQVVSVTPRFFFYELDDALAYEIARETNDELAEIARQNTGIVPVATVPMQSIETAVTEMERVSAAYGFKAVQIGTSINQMDLGDESLARFFRKAHESGLVVFIHPNIFFKPEFLSRHHLSNLVGNPSNTSAAAANIMFSGILDEVPGLKVFLAHGGGFLPYQIGRLTWGYQVRKEAGVVNHPPDFYMKNNFYFDTIVYDQGPLKFLIETVGIDHVIFGTDYPYDMEDRNGIRNINQLDISESGKDKLLHGNIESLLEISRQ